LAAGPSDPVALGQTPDKTFREELCTPREGDPGYQVFSSRLPFYFLAADEHPIDADGKYQIFPIGVNLCPSAANLLFLVEPFQQIFR
jgi:hypothetical protein